jgi:P27 family predicted phage terminase small subunit
MPGYLAGTLAKRWNELAPDLAAMGCLDALNADLLAKYILAENNYLAVSNRVQDALKDGDSEETGKWLAAQDRLTKQILTLGDELGLTPKARKARGLIAPRK